MQIANAAIGSSIGGSLTTTNAISQIIAQFPCSENKLYVFPLHVSCRRTDVAGEASSWALIAHVLVTGGVPVLIGNTSVVSKHVIGNTLAECNVGLSGNLFQVNVVGELNKTFFWRSSGVMSTC